MVLVALSAAYIGGCRRAGTWLVKESVPSHADALVLLMGNFTDRVLQTADLYRSGIADRVINGTGIDAIIYRLSEQCGTATERHANKSNMRCV